MFEIGTSLRQARMRQKLELAQAERVTRIRAKYLGALEDERFDLLPGPAYAKGFLRTYADYLGLESQRFVDEYNTRFAPEEEPAAPAPVRIRRRRLALAPWLLALGLLAASAALLAWRLSSAGGHHAAVLPTTPTHATTSVAPPTPHHPAVVRVARIALVASRGSCWLAVRIGSKLGRPVFERTLQPGEAVRFVSTRLWLRIGAPWNLDARLNGKALPLPGTTGNVVVTAAGVSTTG